MSQLPAPVQPLQVYKVYLRILSPSLHFYCMLQGFIYEARCLQPYLTEDEKQLREVK